MASPSSGFERSSTERKYQPINRIPPTETRLNAHARTDVLPTELDVIIDTSVDGTSPTNLPTVYSSAASPTPHRKVVLCPAHNLVLTALRIHHPFLSASQSSFLLRFLFRLLLHCYPLPDILLFLPSPDTFPILLTYLSNKRVGRRAMECQTDRCSIIGCMSLSS